MPVKRRLSIAVLAAALMTGSAACGAGGSSAVRPDTAVSVSPTPTPTGLAAQSADEILGRARGALSTTTSFRLNGAVNDADGQRTTFDLSVNTQAACEGTLTIEGQGSMEVRHTASQSWLKPDAALWRSIGTQQGDPQDAERAAQVFEGKFLTSGPDDPTLQSALRICKIAQQIGQATEGVGDLSKGAAGTVNGVPTIAIHASAQDGSTTTFYVATEGMAYLIRMTEGTNERDRADFSDYNKPVVVQAPPPDQVIDISAFKQRLQAA